MNIRRTLCVCIAVAMVLSATAAQAEIVRPVTFTIDDGSSAISWGAKGTALDKGYDVIGGRNEATWQASWDLFVDPDPVINGIISVTNPTAVTQTYTLNVSMPISPQLIGGSLTGGSVVGGVTDNNGNGAVLSTSGANPFYYSQIDGGNYVPLFTAPTVVTVVNPFDSASTGKATFGAPIPSQPGPAVLSSIGIKLTFQLSPFDSASFTSVFVANPIPEPATWGMLLTGVALIGARFWRRKR